METLNTPIAWLGALLSFPLLLYWGHGLTERLRSWWGSKPQSARLRRLKRWQGFETADYYGKPIRRPMWWH